MKISIVMCGRNDNFNECMKYSPLYLKDCINFLEEKKDKYNFDYEIIYVEWNYIPNKPLVSESLIKISDKVKCYLVDESIHKSIFTTSYPFLEMEARRIGGIKATGDWIVFKSEESVWIDDGSKDWIDILFEKEEELKNKFCWMKHKVINRDVWYKENRIEVLTTDTGWMNGGDFYLVHKSILEKLQHYPSPIKRDVDGQPRQEIAVNKWIFSKNINEFDLGCCNIHMGIRTKGNNFPDYLSDSELWQNKEIQESLERNSNYDIPVLMNENEVVIDIGACIGSEISELKHYSKNVLCIEPNPECIKNLPSDVIKLQYALKRYNKKNVNFYIFEDFVKSSLLDINNKIEEFYIDWKTRQLVNKKDWTPNKVIQIDQTTLSEIIDRFNITKIYFLKIDTQGSDLEILKGIRDNHFKIIDEVKCEVILNEIDTPYLNQTNTYFNTIKFMESKGYKLINEEYQTAEQEKNLFFKRIKNGI